MRRNPSWNTGALYDLLGKRNMALCIFDLAGVHSPIELKADFTYIRLHGAADSGWQQDVTASDVRAWAKWRTLSA